jgi:hypothetical protein
LSTWTALLVYTLASLGIAVLALRVRDPWTTPPAVIRSGRIVGAPSILLGAAMVVLVSWTLFFQSTSQAYAALIFSDAHYGGGRFARVDRAREATPWQIVIGGLNQSQCGASEG